MKIFSWNCRGLGSPRAVRVLLRLMRIEKPRVMFIMDSGLKKEEVQHIITRSDFEGCFSVDCRGIGREKEGGLILLWKECVTLYFNSLGVT